MGSDKKMSIVKKVKQILLPAYITLIIFSTVGFLMLKWYDITIVYIILQVYIGLHIVAPLDWYLFYKFIKWLKEK